MKRSIRSREMDPGGQLADSHFEGEFDESSGKFWHLEPGIGWVRAVDEERKRVMQSSEGEAETLIDSPEEYADVPLWEKDRGPEHLDRGEDHYQAH